MNKKLLPLGILISCLVFLTGCETDLCENVGCSGHGQCVSDGTSVSCACTDGYSAYKTYCVEPQKINSQLPQYYEYDYSAAKPHPVTGKEYLSNILIVFATESHNAADFLLLVNSVGGQAVAYQPAPRQYIIEFPLDITFEDLTAAKETLEASSFVELVGEEFLSVPASS